MNDSVVISICVLKSLFQRLSLTPSCHVTHPHGLLMMFVLQRKGKTSGEKAHIDSWNEITLKASLSASVCGLILLLLLLLYPLYVQWNCPRDAEMPRCTDVCIHQRGFRDTCVCEPTLFLLLYIYFKLIMNSVSGCNEYFVILNHKLHAHNTVE